MDQREERLARRREVYAAQSDDQREDRLARRREVYAALSDDQREDRLVRSGKFMLLSLITREKTG